MKLQTELPVTINHVILTKNLKENENHISI